MDRKIGCECMARYEAKIDTWLKFEGVENFFNEQIALEIYEEIQVAKPYFIGVADSDTLLWYADKWYKCKACGCLWELNYPDFPAYGFVRKFDDGVYKERGF